MRLPLSVALLLVASTAASIGCGSRTPLDELDFYGTSPGSNPGSNEGTTAVGTPLPDGGIRGLDSSTSTSTSTGTTSSSSGGTDGNGGGCAVTGPPAPWCVPSSTCSIETFPVGLSWANGPHPLETVSIACRSVPTDLQQWVGGGDVGGDGGAWLSLEPFFANPGSFSYSPDTFDVGVARGTAVLAPPPGVPVGSSMAFRACTTTNGCTTCDPPSIIREVDCYLCPPQNCGPGNFLDDSCNCAPIPPTIHGGQ